MPEPKIDLKVKRYDFLTLAGDVVITPQGFLKVPIYASRVGVYDYRMADGSTRREFCPPETLFNPESMASLANAPITNNHRTDVIPDGFITPDNVALVQVGHCCDDVVPEAEKYLKVFGIVQEKKAIADVQGGKHEVSPGYEADVEFTPGVWKDPETGQDYEFDAIQRNRIYNHLAIVDSAREGHDIKIRLDSADAVMYRSDQPANQRSEAMPAPKTLKKYLDDDAPVETIPVGKGDPVHGNPTKPVTKVKLGETEFEMDDDVAKYIHKLHSKALELHDKLDEAASEKTKMQKSMDDMAEELAKHHDDKKKDDDDDDDESEKKMDALRQELKATQKKLDDATDKKKFNNAVQARLALVQGAKGYMGEAKFKELKLDEADDLEIMKAALKLDDAKAVLDDKTPEYIQGAYAQLKSKTVSGKRNDDIGRAILEAGSGGDFESKAAEVREKARNAWKTTPSIAATKATARALTDASGVAGK